MVADDTFHCQHCKEDHILILVMHKWDGYAAKWLLKEFPPKVGKYHQWTIYYINSRETGKTDGDQAVAKHTLTAKSMLLTSWCSVKKMHRIHTTLPPNQQKGWHVPDFWHVYNSKFSCIWSAWRSIMRGSRQASYLTHLMQLKKLLCNLLVRRSWLRLLQPRYLQWHHQSAFRMTESTYYRLQSWSMISLPSDCFQHAQHSASCWWFMSQCRPHLSDLRWVSCGAYYRDVLLKKEMFPAVCSIARRLFIFQQDNAPAHRAHETMNLLARETPKFIGPEPWPSRCEPSWLQDLFWFDERTNVQVTSQWCEELKQLQIEMWTWMEQCIIDNAASKLWKCLQLCVSHKGRHFEPKFDLMICGLQFWLVLLRMYVFVNIVLGVLSIMHMVCVHPSMIACFTNVQ